MSSWRRLSALELVLELLMNLAHLSVSDMHLAVEVVSQTAVVVEPGEIGTADIADLELLVARGTSSVLDRLEVGLLLLKIVDPHAVPPRFDDALADLTVGDHDAKLHVAAGDVVFQIPNLFDLE